MDCYTAAVDPEAPPRVDPAPSAEPAPSATVVLLRAAAPARFEVLLLRRSSKLAFHGGAWVFPGGRIDAEDRQGGVDALAAARRGAVREAREEAGLELDPGALVPFARWTTPVGPPRRFVTWFFAAIAGDDRVEVDGGEIHDHRWFEPEAALAARAGGRIELPPPTFVTLTRLAAFARADDALAELTRSDTEVFTPRLQRVPGGMCSLYEADAGYAELDVDAPGARHRVWMLDSGWRYERSGF